MLGIADDGAVDPREALARVFRAAAERCSSKPQLARLLIGYSIDVLEADAAVTENMRKALTLAARL